MKRRTKKIIQRFRYLPEVLWANALRLLRVGSIDAHTFLAPYRRMLFQGKLTVDEFTNLKNRLFPTRR